jgi:hypothetical protein
MILNDAPSSAKWQFASAIGFEALKSFEESNHPVIGAESATIAMAK